MTALCMELNAALAAQLEGAGFEVFGAARVGEYNRALDADLEGFRLPELAGENTLALVVGNTRRLWPLFLRAYRETALGDEVHPLDAYSRMHIGGAAAELSTRFGVAHALRYSFDPAPNTVAIQRLAGLAGVAEASPVGLSIHPEHGPWFSLRAAVVFAAEGPRASTPPATCSVCVERPCLVARERMVMATGGVYTRETFQEHWQTWLAMRDACPVGAAAGARYSDPQVRYHYLKQLQTLRE